MINVKCYNNKENLTIISLNIANLLSKFTLFKSFLNNIKTYDNEADVIIVVETHISKPETFGFTAEELKNILPEYQFYHKGRSLKKAGGVGIFVRKALGSEVNVLDEIPFIEEHFENVVIQVPKIIKPANGFNSKDLVVAAIYRQPNNNNHDIFNQELEKLLTTVDKRKNELVIAGDFNLDLLKYEHHLPTASYIDLTTQHGLLPRIVRPTRIKKQSATLIDHILTKNSDSFVISGIIDTEIAGSYGYTDHFPVFTILKAKATAKPKDETVTRTYFTQKDHLDRRERLKGEDWNDVYEQTDPNQIYDLIQEKYGKHYHESKTTKTFKK